MHEVTGEQGKTLKAKPSRFVKYGLKPESLGLTPHLRYNDNGIAIACAVSRYLRNLMEGRNMIRASVMYPNEQGKKFDFDFYIKKHMVLVHKKLDSLGLVRSEVDKAVEADAPFIVIGHLYFNSLEEFQNGFFAHAAEFGADLANYTDIIPQMQISQIIK